MTEEIRKSLEEYIVIENLIGNIVELDEVLCNLVDNNKSDEGSLKRAVLCIYQLLHGYNKWQVKFGKKVFHKLVAQLARGQSCSIAVLILSCTKIYFRKFSKQQGQYLIEELWCLSTTNEQQPHASLILMQMFDCFVDVIDGFLYAEELHNVIRQLLISELLEERKAGLNIMRQLLAAIEKSNDDTKLIVFGWPDRQQFLSSWSTYISTWEQLELAPAAVDLNSLKDLQCNDNSRWKAWLNLLEKTLLSHENVLVIQKTLHYFMENYKFVELNESMQRQFLLTTNNIELYNVDGLFWDKNVRDRFYDFKYYYVPIHFKGFIKDAQVQILEIFVTIDWNPVSLHFWLTRLTSEQPTHPSISKVLLMRLSDIVRRVPNRKMRKSLRDQFSQLFKATIDKLSVPEYIEFSEILYNIDEDYNSHHFFQMKVERAASLEGVLKPFSKRFYQIMSNRFKTYDYNDLLCCPYKYFHRNFKRTIKRLTNVPKEQHGWLRFLIVFDIEHTDPIIEFCRSQYDVDLVRLSTASLSLNEFFTEIAKKLIWKPEEEADFIRKKCVDLYVEQRLRKWSDLSKLGLNPIELLSMGTIGTFAVLIKLLGNHDSRLPPEVLSSMMETLKKTCLHRKDVCTIFVRHAFDYAKRNLTASEVEALTYDILNIDRTHTELTYQVVCQTTLNQETLIRGLLHGEPTSGIKRIASAYEEMLVHTIPNMMRLRHGFKFEVRHNTKNVFDELLRINSVLTQRRPRYYENSKVHCLKMRIAQGIFYLHDRDRLPYWSEGLWTALLTEYDHENIRYLYEVMIVTFAPNLEILLEKLRAAAHYTANQQVSLMAVVFFYCMFYWGKMSTMQLTDVLKLLLPFTMGANFRTRLHAQLFSYCIILKAEENKIELPHSCDIKQAVLDACGNKLAEYLLQPRFNFPAFYYKFSLCISDMILYVTNAPFDECGYWFLRNSFNCHFQENFNNVRNAYIRQAASRQSTYIAEADDINLDFGAYEKNMRSIEEIIFGNGEIKARPDKEDEIFVVASLVDKLPNLAGIARACEVLGTKNLVVNSKMRIEKSDFQIFSMNDHHNLNILEIKPAELAAFLEQRRNEGFKIVGAEQTAYSESFVDFQFPAKCVLLLGHEKHGLSSTLLGYLDYTVETPQFGSVRSLNVDVTGALFMWEYCKQHKLESAVV